MSGGHFGHPSTSPSSSATSAAPIAAETYPREITAAFVAMVLFSAGNLIVRGAPLETVQLGLFRTAIGALLYNVVLGIRGGRISVASLRLALPGATGWACQLLSFYAALRTTSTASATVILALQPLFMVPIARRLYGERYSPRHVMLMVAAIAGTGLVVSSSSAGDSWSLGGDLLALVATLSGCLYFVGTKRARVTLSPLDYMTSLLTIATCIVAPVALVSGTSVRVGSATDLLWPVVLAFIPGTGHLLLSWSQRNLSVAMTSMITLDVVPMTTVGAMIFFSDTLTLVQVVGLVVVLGSLALFVRSPAALAKPGEKLVGT